MKVKVVVGRGAERWLRAAFSADPAGWASVATATQRRGDNDTEDVDVYEGEYDEYDDEDGEDDERYERRGGRRRRRRRRSGAGAGDR